MHITLIKHYLVVLQCPVLSSSTAVHYLYSTELCILSPDTMLAGGPLTAAVFLLGLTAVTSGQEEFRVANMFSSGMVLQREPHSPNIWGFGPPNSRVGLNISLGEEFLHITDNVPVTEDGLWSVGLGSWPPGIGYSLHIWLEDTGDLITLSDIAFGDVWVCSGQSNMVLKVTVSFSSPEI